MNRDVREVMNERIENHLAAQRSRDAEEMEFYDNQLPKAIKNRVDEAIYGLEAAQQSFNAAGLNRAEMAVRNQIVTAKREAVREYRAKHKLVEVYLRTKRQLEMHGINSPQLLEIYA